MSRQHPDLSVHFFQKIITNTDPDVVISEVEITTGAGRGDNYTSALYRVRASGNKNAIPWSKSYICKCLPANRERREAFKSEILFQNEVMFYTRALPALSNFQASRGHSIFQEIPKVYLAEKHILVLEDLKESDFLMADRKKALDLKHCQAIIKTLGHFHGAWFAMKSVSPEIFAKEVTSVVSECLFREEYEGWYREYYRRAGSNALQMVKETLKDHPQSDKYFKKFETFMSNGFFLRMVKDMKAKEPLAVLLHGDCWTNNFLFQYDHHGNITKVCMVDFQFARYGSPAQDLVQLLFSCTNKSLRSAHMPSLLKTYTAAFREALDKLGSSTELLGSKNLSQVFENEMKMCSKLGLGLSVDMIPICTCDSDQAPDLYQPNAEFDSLLDKANTEDEAQSSPPGQPNAECNSQGSSLDKANTEDEAQASPPGQPNAECNSQVSSLDKAYTEDETQASPSGQSNAKFETQASPSGQLYAERETQPRPVLYPPNIEQPANTHPDTTSNSEATKQRMTELIVELVDANLL